MKLSVVMPVYNEIATLAEILRRARVVEISKEILIVDDGSTDGTREFLRRLEETGPLSDTWNQIRILYQERNQGKGAALRRGFQEATGEYVIIQDADLEYDPRDYPKLLEPLLDGRADVVYGSRFLGGPHRVFLFWHFVGNKILTTLANVLTNLTLTDAWACYKVFRTSLLKKITIEQNRFACDAEITAKVAKLNCRIYEVPISYSGRDYADGKKITWKDAIPAIYATIRYNLFP